MVYVSNGTWSWIGWAIEGIDIWCKLVYNNNNKHKWKGM